MTLGPAAGLRILVVDDEPAMVGAITALVGTAGHQVITAYDGDAALRRFEEEGPDLVLLDLAMPGRDGVDVCREIRRTSRTPVIVLTGEADELAKVEALDAGADDYVTKPFGKQELLARIRAVMRRHEAGETPAGGLHVGRLTLDTGRHEASVEGSVLALTRTEFALLAALVSAGWWGTTACSQRAGRATRTRIRSGSSPTWPGCAPSWRSRARRSPPACEAWATAWRQPRSRGALQPAAIPGRARSWRPRPRPPASASSSRPAGRPTWGRSRARSATPGTRS